MDPKTSFTGQFHAQAYINMSGIGKSRPQNPHVYKFGDFVGPSIGRIKIIIAMPNYSFIPLNTDYFDVNVHILIGLFVLNRQRKTRGW